MLPPGRARKQRAPVKRTLWFAAPEQLAHRCKTTPVHSRYPVSAQRCQMRGGRIAFVAVESVLRMSVVQLQHERVARRFRQY